MQKRLASAAPAWSFTVALTVALVISFGIDFVVVGGLGQMLEPFALWQAFYWSLGLSVATFLVALVVVWRQQRRLQLESAAIPPLFPGHPASCSICGADLPPAPGQAVVRCGYCHTDCVVAPHVIERSARRHAEHLALMGRRLRGLRQQQDKRRSRPLITVIVLAVVGPVGVVIAAGLLDRWAAMRPPAYTIAPRDGAPCVQQVHHDLYGQVYVAPTDHRNFADMTPAKGRVKRIAIDSLVGKKVHGDGARPAVVKSIDRPRSYAAFHRPSPMLVLEQDGKTTRQEMLETCLLRGEPPIILREVDERVSDAALGPKFAAFVVGSRLWVVDRDEAEVRSAHWERDWGHLTVTADGFFALTDGGLDHWRVEPNGRLTEPRRLVRGGKELDALGAEGRDLLLVDGRDLLRLSIPKDDGDIARRVVASLPGKRWTEILAIDGRIYLRDLRDLWVVGDGEARQVKAHQPGRRVVQIGDHLGWVAPRSHGELYRQDGEEAKLVGLRLGNNRYRGSAAGLWWSGWFGPREPGIRLVDEEGNLVWDAAPGVDDPIFVAGDERGVFWVSKGPERGSRVLSMRRRKAEGDSP